VLTQHRYRLATGGYHAPELIGDLVTAPAEGGLPETVGVGAELGQSLAGAGLAAPGGRERER
jgi:hypothetical protein